MQFGYSRVSTQEHAPYLRQDALIKAEHERILTETCSGSVACADRTELQRLCEQMHRDDLLVVWRLDRLGCNLKDLLAFVNGLETKVVQFASLTEQMNTKTSMGSLMFQTFGATAEHDRGLTPERALAAPASARARGRQGGGPRVITKGKLHTVQALIQDKPFPISQIRQTVGLGRNTFYGYLTPEGSLLEKETTAQGTQIGAK